MDYNNLFKGEGKVACDTETTGLVYQGAFADYGFYPSQPFAFSFTTYEAKNWYTCSGPMSTFGWRAKNLQPPHHHGIESLRTS